MQEYHNVTSALGSISILPKTATMLNPFQERYADLPQPDAIQSMTPAEIGRAILTRVAERIEDAKGFVPRDFARGAAEHVANGSKHYEQLILEGLGFLDRSGMFTTKPGSLNGDWFVLSRAGLVAVTQAHSYAPAAIAGLEVRALLHPRIAAAALGHVERGGTFLDDAATAAFREVEERVRTSASLETSVAGKEIFYKAFGDSGPLVPREMNMAEARSFKELLAGAYGFFRNPSAHRHAQEDAAQAMRILLVASALMYILDELEASQNTNSD